MVFTDNNPLSHLSKLGATEQRWAAQLATFNFQIRYRSGKSNKNADALSHQNFPEEGLLGGLALGTLVPALLQPAEEASSVVEVQQSVITTCLVLLVLSLVCCRLETQSSLRFCHFGSGRPLPGWRNGSGCLWRH